MDSICSTFSLNAQQERAFRIVAQHSLHAGGDQLRMYIGGMGGTGKSQVIKSLNEFFRERRMGDALSLLAPTGAAAVLLGGSTYHSFLGFNKGTSDDEYSFSSPNALAELDSKMKNVKYLFIDEVSMISLQSLQSISERLNQVRNSTSTSPFGGFNVIFAGDFAQLKPAMGSPIYTTLAKIRHGITPARIRPSKSIEKATEGKALWNQVTTVVMLTQNMRQTSQSINESKYRNLLEHLRMRACTDDDISFLRSLQADSSQEKRVFARSLPRNLSIITPFNVERDTINLIGQSLLSAEMGKPLIKFYSIDRPVKHQQTSADPFLKTGHISIREQDELWNLLPGKTQHIPGSLSICKGMPVMIRKNDATQLGVTNGAEAFVVTWDCHEFRQGMYTLDTLFVELRDPPRPIHIPGLPPNVVPLVAREEQVECHYPSRYKRHVRRRQVPVVLNFAMTDYSSQGRSREINVVYLRNCRTHHSVYVALSRSTSAEKTLILDGVNENLLKGGLGADLHRKFQHINKLDRITLYRYESLFIQDVPSPTRIALFHAFDKYLSARGIGDGENRRARLLSQSTGSLTHHHPRQLNNSSTGRNVAQRQPRDDDIQFPVPRVHSENPSYVGLRLLRFNTVHVLSQAPHLLHFLSLSSSSLYFHNIPCT
jgi:hypothetical protein